MSKKKLGGPALSFQLAENGVYFTEIRPTPFTLGVLIEISKANDIWNGSFITFHAVPQQRNHLPAKAAARPTPIPLPAFTVPAAFPPITKDMVSAKISFASPAFDELILGMRKVTENISLTKQKLSNEERAALEVAAELVWNFPKELSRQF